MDYAFLGAFALGGLSGFLFRHLTSMLVATAIVGCGMATAYHVWLNADAARRDALEGVGYVMAFVYPAGGCALGWLANMWKRGSQ